MKAAILQSNYIPWKGYFDIIARSDMFILYDEVQYTKNDWRNRNRIKTHNGLQWLTIPVLFSGKFGQAISETRVVQDGWTSKHLKSITLNYTKSPFWKHYEDAFEGLYDDLQKEVFLSRINLRCISLLCKLLAIETEIIWSSDIPVVNTGKNERLIDILKAVGATSYISGPAAKDYMDVSLFNKKGIDVSFMDYNNYPLYPQLHGDFIHEVSVIDVLFNVGPEARKYICSK